MVAEDFLQDPRVREWLDGVEPAWTLLTFDSLRALRQQQSIREGPIKFATNLTADDIQASAAARNALILIRRAIETAGLPVTATGNLTRAVVAEMCKLAKMLHVSLDWRTLLRLGLHMTQQLTRYECSRSSAPRPS